jgi:hypothetical protein
LLTAGRNDVNWLPSFPTASRGRKVNPQERKRHLLEDAAPVAVLAVHDLGLVRVQLQPDLTQPLLQRSQHLACLRPGDAVDHRIVGVALERNRRELPSQPQVERVVHEQVRQNG